jgi:hypothetical protein
MNGKAVEADEALEAVEASQEFVGYPPAKLLE